MELNVNAVNVFRITNNILHDYNELGTRIPAFFVFQNKQFGFRFRVNGNDNYATQYDYELNKQYQIELSQKKNSDGKAIYKIIINGETIHEVINTTPRSFDNALLYLSDVHSDTFAPYGSLANLRISSALSKLIKSYIEIPAFFLWFMDLIAHYRAYKVSIFHGKVLTAKKFEIYISEPTFVISV